MRIRFIFVLSIFFLVVFPSVSTSLEVSSPILSDPLAKDTFSFQEPSEKNLSDKLVLWATYYYLPEFMDGQGDFALRDMNNIELGPKLTREDWCDAAMEGSVRIKDKTGLGKTFNYAGLTAENGVDCSLSFKMDVSRTKFREAHGPYGDGIEDYILVPYRTIATDIQKIAPGTVLYIPSARGANITLPSGRVIIHDGYFFAGDKGGAIKNNHIDVFINSQDSASFFPWIKSNKNKTFEAYIVLDSKIISALHDLHLGN